MATPAVARARGAGAGRSGRCGVTAYTLDSDQYGTVIVALALIVLLLAIQTIGGWRR